MKEENKIKVIERFDKYYSEINNKGVFIMTINTFILGAFLIGYKDLIKFVCCCNIYLFNILVFIVLLSSIISMMFIITAIIPFLNSNKKSFWFFNDIANRTKQEFLNKIDTQTELELTEDINEQIYYLSIGLKKKHNKVTIALIINLMQFLIIIKITTLILF